MEWNRMKYFERQKTKTGNKRGNFCPLRSEIGFRGLGERMWKENTTTKRVTKNKTKIENKNTKMKQNKRTYETRRNR